MPWVQNGWGPGRRCPHPSRSFTQAGRQAEHVPQRRQLPLRLLLTNRDVQISRFPKRSKDPRFCVKPVNSSSQWVLFYKGETSRRGLPGRVRHTPARRQGMQTGSASF